VRSAGGQPDLSGVVLHVRKGEVHIGSFLGDLLSFKYCTSELVPVVTDAD
jgi:hypothetical protein